VDAAGDTMVLAGRIEFEYGAHSPYPSSDL